MGSPISTMPLPNRTPPTGRHAPAFLGLVVALMGLIAQAAGAAEPSRNVNDYFALAFRRMLLKNFHVEAPGCNLGVNCEETGRTCGRLSMSEATVSAPGQLVGDNVCGPGSFYEVFRNNTGAYCSPNCSMISHPGPGPNCESTFSTPLLGDLDGDGQASCDDHCTVDIGDVAAACGVAYPFVTPCQPSRGVIVNADSDCVPANFDLVPGNHQCDLAADAYGMIRVRNKGRISFAAGTTTACTLAVAKAARVTSTGSALIQIPGDGWASFGNLSDVGGECRGFKVVTEFGPLRFGKHGEFHLDACSLGGTLKLGHDNNLRGRFVSGEFIVSNYNNTGACCTANSTTTSTTTSTISSTTTSTSLPLGSVCCQDTNQEPPLCGSAPTAGDCLADGGIPGPVNSVCHADPEGGGRCTDAPPNPGGCCQFDGACAIGGDMNDVHCSSLGGAFVPDAICDPDGNCVVVTTSTTVVTVTTVTVTSTSSTSSSTSTTNNTTSTTTNGGSTTSTTLPSGPICCEIITQQPPLCGSTATTADCLAVGGTPGPTESNCQAEPEGGGRCKTGPPNPGGCCQLDGGCAIGGGFDQSGCTSAGGAFIPDAVCNPSGQCEPVTSSTTSTTNSTISTVTSSTTSTTSTSASSTSNTSTPTTSTSSTTIASQPVCCENAIQDPPLCGSAASSADCLAAGGTPGVADSVCQADPQGGGRCKKGPPNPGDCCELDGGCAIGGDYDQATCTNLGGTFVPDAICTPSGDCEPSTGTTSTTVTTVTTISTTSSSIASTSTSATSSSIGSTSTSTTSSTSTTNHTAKTTSTSTSSTTSTTRQGAGFFTRTLGFYKTHPGVTQWILDQADGISVCGVELTNTNDDDAHSAIEALCISPLGDQRLQLARQLTAAALTMAAGGATYGDFGACNTLCANGTGSIYAVGDCINSADNFNNSGDNLSAPFDGFESGSTTTCQLAHMTGCNILDPESCLH